VAGNGKIKQRGMAGRNQRRILLLGKYPSVYLEIMLTLGMDIPPALRFWDIQGFRVRKYP
jgi:hypothetical protein